MTQRSTIDRYLAASECVTHRMRNLLTPAGLRLDVWRLQGQDVTIAASEAERMRAALQEVVALLDGLEWLRVDAGATTLPGGTPWADAVGALLTALGGSKASISVEQVGFGRAPLPYIAFTQLIVDLALAAEHIARGASWQIHLSLTEHNVCATVRLTAAAGMWLDPLVQAIGGRWDDRNGAVVLRGEPTVCATPQATTLLLHFTAPLEARGPAMVTRTNTEFRGPITVLCIDDNVTLLDALADRLARAPGFGPFLRAITLDAAFEQLQTRTVSVILLDAQLATPHDPLVAVTELRQRCPGARLALFTGRTDEALVAWARSNALDGFVPKGLATSVFLDALVRLGHGEAVWLIHDDI